MAETIRQTEGAPEIYPDAAEGLSTEAAALDADMIWQRVEAYIAHRFTPREVVWIVQGPGHWSPPLAPASVTDVHAWAGDAGFVSVTPAASPYGGYDFPGDGPWRVTADVGGGDVPAGVQEAFRRLAEYLADDPGTAGASSTSVAIGPIQEELERSPNWVAKAMQHSGAADLLRNYRRA